MNFISVILLFPMFAFFLISLSGTHIIYIFFTLMFHRFLCLIFLYSFIFHLSHFSIPIFYHLIQWSFFIPPQMCWNLIVIFSLTVIFKSKICLIKKFFLFLYWKSPFDKGFITFSDYSFSYLLYMFNSTNIVPLSR
jgi:hypothetical protein